MKGRSQNKKKSLRKLAGYRKWWIQFVQFEIVSRWDNFKTIWRRTYKNVLRTSLEWYQLWKLPLCGTNQTGLWDAPFVHRCDYLGSCDDHMICVNLSHYLFCYIVFLLKSLLNMIDSYFNESQLLLLLLLL